MSQVRPALVLLAVTIMALLISACATPGPGANRRSQRCRTGPRAGGEQPAGLQVYPLRNPAVTELTEAALAAEQAGDLDQAAMLLERALRIESRDPELLQHMAEIRLERGEWEQADSFAGRSFDVGPRGRRAVPAATGAPWPWHASA